MVEQQHVPPRVAPSRSLSGNAYQGLPIPLCEVFTDLLSRMDAREEVRVLLREADRCGIGGRFRSAIAADPAPVGYDFDEADRVAELRDLQWRKDST